MEAKTTPAIKENYYLEKYREYLNALSDFGRVEHICKTVDRYGDKAVALFTLIFDDVDFFTAKEDANIVAAKILSDLINGKSLRND